MILQPGLADFVVEQLSLSPDKKDFSVGEPVLITTVIKNQGAAPSSPVWVDLYINPAAPPTASNKLWYQTCSLQPCFGLAWAVPTLAPGESITLTSQLASYTPEYSVWPGWFAAGTTDIYVYVDSWEPESISGAVAESDETNNQSHLAGLTASGANPPSARSRLTSFSWRPAAPAAEAMRRHIP